MTPLLPLAALLLGGAPNEPGKPPISAQTMRSGGAQDADQAKLRFDHADLTIEVIPESHQLKGLAKLSFTASAPLERLVLDLDPNLPVSAIAIDGHALAAGQWSNAEGRLIVALPAPVPAGRSFTATIDYGGTPHVAVRAPWDDGIVWAKQPDGTPWIATTTQGYGCDLFWPCIDHPRGEVALLDTRIVVPEGLSAPGNGVLKSKARLGGGRTAWHWQARSVNPYLFALQIGSYGEISGSYTSRFGNRVPLHFWHRPDKAKEAQGLFAEFAPTLDFFEKFIGPWPWPEEKLGLVETPHMGMEHQTINAYGNNYAKGPASFDWLFQHELSHEWFGNLMTAADWDDFWLHEGFGQYMQPLYEQQRVGEARYRVMMAYEREQIQNRAPLVFGRTRTADEVYEDDNGGTGQDIYHKGAWLLHTLRYTIGDDAFFRATRRLVYGRPDPKPGNFKPRLVTSDEFVRLVSEEAGQDMAWFFDVYMREAALPELVETRTGDTLTLRWKAPKGKPFPLPVDVRVGDKVERVAMTGDVGTLKVPAGAKVTIDPMARVLRALPSDRAE